MSKASKITVISIVAVAVAAGLITPKFYGYKLQKQFTEAVQQFNAENSGFSLQVKSYQPGWFNSHSSLQLLANGSTTPLATANITIGHGPLVWQDGSPHFALAAIQGDIIPQANTFSNGHLEGLLSHQQQLSGKLQFDPYQDKESDGSSTNITGLRALYTVNMAQPQSFDLTLAADKLSIVADANDNLNVSDVSISIDGNKLANGSWNLTNSLHVGPSAVKLHADSSDARVSSIQALDLKNLYINSAAINNLQQNLLTEGWFQLFNDTVVNLFTPQTEIHIQNMQVSGPGLQMSYSLNLSWPTMALHHTGMDLLTQIQGDYSLNAPLFSFSQDGGTIQIKDLIINSNVQPNWQGSGAITLKSLQVSAEQQSLFSINNFNFNSEITRDKLWNQAWAMNSDQICYNGQCINKLTAKLNGQNLNYAQRMNQLQSLFQDAFAQSTSDTLFEILNDTRNNVAQSLTKDSQFTGSAEWDNTEGHFNASGSCQWPQLNPKAVWDTTNCDTQFSFPNYYLQQTLTSLQQPPYRLLTSGKQQSEHKFDRVFSRQQVLLQGIQTWVSQGKLSVNGSQVNVAANIVNGKITQLSGQKLTALDQAYIAYYNHHYTKALNLFKQAASNNADAQYYVGEMYFNGIGSKVNDDLADQWLARAANSNVAQAYIMQANMTNNNAQALVLANKAATAFGQSNNIPTMSFIGVLYYNIEQYQQAMTWLKRAAAAQDAMANYVLGQMYQNGNGVRVDLKQALQYYQAAASDIPEAKAAALSIQSQLQSK